MSKPDQYPLFTHWLKTLDWILDKCEKMPKHVRFSLTGRIANLSLDIQEVIVEAIYTKDRKPVLDKMNMQLSKLRVLIRVCYNRRYISHRQYSFIATEMNKAGNMIGGWRK